MKQKEKEKLAPTTPYRDPMKIIIGLLQLLMNPAIDSKTIIDYLVHHRIDVDTYVPTMDGNKQLPLLFYCCSLPQLGDAVTYLIDHK